jgi:hypothetical protein
MKLYFKFVLILYVLCFAYTCIFSLNSYSHIDINNLEDLTIWIHNNIKYKSDGKFDYWQTPEETMRLKTGDCEDMCILFQDIAKKKLNIIVYVLALSDKINIMFGHSIIIYQDMGYDPTIGKFALLSTITINANVCLWKIFNYEEMREGIKINNKR